jgi:hypothetical protein
VQQLNIPRNTLGAMAPPADAPSQQSSSQWHPIFYALAGTTGAFLGGGLIGYVAGGRGGALTGAALASGMSSVADAAVFHRDGYKALAVLSGVLGILAVGTALARSRRF